MFLDAHTFESLEYLDNYRNEVVVVPGALAGVTSIDLHVSFNSKHKLQVENLEPTMSTLAFHTQPTARFGPLTKPLQGFAWGKSFRPFDGTVDFQGGSGGSHSTTVGHTVLFETITDPQIISQFVGNEINIPVQFVRNSSIVGGSNASRINSTFGWHGIIRYNY